MTRVLDLTRTVAGGYCASMLALAGAEVMRREVVSDSLAAPLDDQFVLDYVRRGTIAGEPLQPAHVREALRDFDAVIEDWGPGMLELLAGNEARLRMPAPALVITRLSEFGQYGPWANWAGSELVNLAAGGMLHLTGQWDRPPVQLAPYQAQLTSGLLAAIATLTALREGAAVTIDLSKQEAVLALVNPAPSEYLYGGTIPARDGRVAAMPRIERASDRWVYVGPGAALTADYTRYAACVGIPEFAEERFATPERRMENWDEHQRLLRARLLQRTAAEWVDAGAEHHLTFGYVQDTTELLRDPVLAERRYFGAATLGGESASAPLAPYLIDGVRPVTLQVVPTPPTHSTLPARTVRSSVRAYPGADAAKAPQPLTGLRVLAWEQAVALPMTTRLLANLGATVVRLESHRRLRPRPRYLANDLIQDKESIALDLTQPEAQAVARRLAATADVFCENFTPRVKRQFGLAYDDLRGANPRLIMLSLSGYGQTGAWSERPTYGPGIEAASGHALSAGFPDAPPTRPGTVVYADNISGWYAALAILGALNRRDATGRGCNIDLAMYEALAYHLGPLIARSSITGEAVARRGNGDPAALLQDVFESASPGRWLAVTVFPAMEGALRRVVSAPESGDLPAALATWAARHTAEEGAELLQSAGIAASPVLDAKHLLSNPHLRARGAFSLIQHAGPVHGYIAHPHVGLPWRVEGCTEPAVREAPAIGEHSRAVLHEWLQMDTAEVDALVASGALGEHEADPPPKPRTAPDVARRRLDWQLISGYDSDPEASIGLDADGRWHPAPAAL